MDNCFGRWCTCCIRLPFKKSFWDTTFQNSMVLGVCSYMWWTLVRMLEDQDGAALQNLGFDWMNISARTCISHRLNMIQSSVEIKLLAFDMFDLSFPGSLWAICGSCHLECRRLWRQGPPHFSWRLVAFWVIGKQLTLRNRQTDAIFTASTLLLVLF